MKAVLEPCPFCGIHHNTPIEEKEMIINGLRTALERFGQHTSQCRANQTGRDEPDCNCGLRAALAPNKEAQ
jgi:hypothetical protein